MENVKLQPNTTQIPNMIIDQWLPILTGTEFRLLMVICRQTYGWHKDSDYLSYSQLIKRTGSANGSIGNALKSLREKGFIKVLNSKGKQLFTKEECHGQELHYQIAVTSPKIGEGFSKKWNPKIGDTKETNTKDISKDIYDDTPKRGASCPLKNPTNPLKAKYPNGHIECVEYVNSFKFVNKGKQFRFLHQLLRSGLDFPDLDKLIRGIEKKPYFKENGFDFATVAGEADRRMNASI